MPGIDFISQNVSIGVVGKQTEFIVYDDDDVDKFLNLLDPSERRGRGAPTVGADGDDAPPPPDAPGDDAPAAPVLVADTMDTTD